MDGKILDDLYDSLLESTGGKKLIKRAMVTKDSAVIVRAATEALRKAFSIPMVIAELKTAEKSNQFRKEGNLHYLKKNYKNAILCYNKALAYAPNNSIEVKLAYSNISAVLLAINAYRDCNSNIKAALALDCPEFLRTKLQKRKTEADKNMGSEMMRDMRLLNGNTLAYAMFNEPRNVEISCASADISVDDGKTPVAAKEIKSGRMVALERAFVSVQGENAEYISCYYCHKMCFFFIPCKGCCMALFCSDECEKKCLEEFHRVECYVLAYMGSMFWRDVNRMTVRAAIKMSLKLGWEELRVASQKIGEKRLRESSVSEAFDCNNPVSILCYNDRNIKVSADNMIRSSLICAGAVHCLGRVAGYLPEETKKREEAIDSLSRILLNLNTTYLRKIKYECSAFDYKNEKYTLASQRNSGWFSFTSKIAHSCEPNLFVMGLNDQIGLVALRRIKKGEPLSICYIDHHYDLTIIPDSKNKQIRQKRTYNAIQYSCNCRVCLLDWDAKSHKPVKLTRERDETFCQAQRAMLSGDFSHQLKAVSEGLDDLAEYANTTQHFQLYKNLKNTLAMCQMAKNPNKSYECALDYMYICN